MDATSIRQEAGMLTESLASQVGLDQENGAASAKYTIGYTDSSAKLAVIKQVHQIGGTLKCECFGVIEGYFVIVEPKGVDLMVSIFLVYARPSPTHL
jgi:hypothetical protein